MTDGNGHHPHPERLAQRVLITAPVGRDAPVLGDVLRRAGIPCKICPHVDELLATLDEGAGALLLTEEALTPESAKHLAVALETQPPWSDLPVVLLTAGHRHEPRESESIHLLSAKGANLSILQRPTRALTLTTAIQSALRARNRQYEVRDHLDQQERIARALRQSEEWRRLMIESVKDYALFTMDLNRHVATWNTGAQRLFGWSEPEIIGQDVSVLYTPEDRAAGVPEKELHVARIRGRCEDSRWHMRKDGSRFFASGVSRPLADGKLQGYIKIAQDVTLRRQMELEREELLAREQAAREEAERANRAKDDFLAALSHELRTPLTPVLLTASLIEEDPEVSPQIRQDVQTIRRNVELEARLIDDLLDLTRIARGKLQLKPEVVDVHLLARAVQEICCRHGEGPQPTLELRARRRHVRGSEPAPAGALESAQQRAQIHLHHREGHHSHQQSHRSVHSHRGDRHRHRHRSASAAAAVPGFRAGWRGRHASVWRLGTGSIDHQGSG